VSNNIHYHNVIIQGRAISLRKRCIVYEANSDKQFAIATIVLIKLSIGRNTSSRH